MKNLAALVLLLCLSAGAAAQLRTIPAEAQRGFIRHLQGSLVAIDGQERTLAPGATIRGLDNLILVPTALPAEGVQAEYLVDTGGQVSRVWILSADEAAREKPRAP